MVASDQIYNFDQIRNQVHYFQPAQNVRVCMAEEFKMIQRDEYPEPRLFDRDGNLYVEVSVPTSLWHLFGTNAKRRGSLRTNNKNIAH